MELLKEFQQGKFRRLWDCKHNMEEITATLLSSPRTDEKLKIQMLQTMANNVKRNIVSPTSFSGSETDQHHDDIQQHNDEVRAKLWTQFQHMVKNNPERLRDI